jgi:hypothetical protein
MEADYLLAQLGGDYSKASSQEFRNLVEAQLKRRKAFFSVEAIGGTHPLESALWTLYYRSRGETAKAMASTRELELLIEKITALFFFSQHAQEGVGSKGLQIFRSGLPGKASDAEILAKLEREMAILKLGKAGEIRRLKSLLRSREASKEKTEESYQKVARYWLLLAAFTHYRQELKKERLPDSEFYDASCKAVIQEMFTELVPLKFGQKTFNETAP